MYELRLACLLNAALKLVVRLGSGMTVSGGTCRFILGMQTGL